MEYETIQVRVPKLSDEQRKQFEEVAEHRPCNKGELQLDGYNKWKVRDTNESDVAFICLRPKPPAEPEWITPDSEFVAANPMCDAEFSVRGEPWYRLRLAIVVDGDRPYIALDHANRPSGWEKCRVRNPAWKPEPQWRPATAADIGKPCRVRDYEDAPWACNPLLPLGEVNSILSLKYKRTDGVCWRYCEVLD